MNLTADNYFSTESEQFYMSSTQFKNFMQCEAAAMAQIKGEFIRTKSTAMLVGSYVDAYFGGELDLFKAENHEIFTRNGELKSEFKQADKIIDRIERDPVFMDDMSGEQQVIMTGVINGVPFKIKIDILHPDRSVDLKIMADVADKWKDGECKTFWAYWGHDIQGAIYREVRAQNDGAVKPFDLSVATKETEPDLQRFRFSDETLAEAYQLVYNLAPRFEAIKKGVIEPMRCGKCDYCKSTKVLKKDEITTI